MKETMEDLSQRLDNPDSHSVAGKLNREILDGLNVHSPMNLMADEFNQAAERYYRDRLRKLHVAESFRILEEDFSSLCTDGNNFGSDDRRKRFIVYWRIETCEVSYCYQERCDGRAGGEDDLGDSSISC
jgi:hypothetical protein